MTMQNINLETGKVRYSSYNFIGIRYIFKCNNLIDLKARLSASGITPYVFKYRFLSMGEFLVEMVYEEEVYWNKFEEIEKFLDTHISRDMTEMEESLECPTMSYY